MHYCSGDSAAQIAALVIAGAKGPAGVKRVTLYHYQDSLPESAEMEAAVAAAFREAAATAGTHPAEQCFYYQD